MGHSCGMQIVQQYLTAALDSLRSGNHRANIIDVEARAGQDRLTDRQARDEVERLFLTGIDKAGVQHAINAGKAVTHNVQNPRAALFVPCGPHECKALDLAICQTGKGVGMALAVHPFDGERGRIAFARTVGGDNFKRLHDLIKPEQTILIAGLRDQQHLRLKIAGRVIPCEGRAIAVKGHNASWDLHLNSRRIIADRRHIHAFEHSVVLPQQFRPLARCQDARQFEIVRLLPSAHRVTGSTPVKAIDRGIVEPGPLQRDLQLFLFVKSEQPFSGAGLLWGFIGGDDGLWLWFRNDLHDDRGFARGLDRAADRPELIPKARAIHNVAV